MGTEIFPDAPLKFYVEAAFEVRLARRLKNLYPDFDQLPEDERKALKTRIEMELHERDRRDRERSISPMRAAHDALPVDNSTCPLTAIVQGMYDAALHRGLV
jgi:cytidylate kinase